MSGPEIAAIRKYWVRGDEERHAGIYVEWRGQRYGKGPILWAVTAGPMCLSRSGRWEWEPQPSSRTDAFLKRCRWHSFSDARHAAETLVELEAS